MYIFYIFSPAHDVYWSAGFLDNKIFSDASSFKGFSTRRKIISFVLEFEVLLILEKDACKSKH